jgi:hypothetical protein
LRLGLGSDAELGLAEDLWKGSGPEDLAQGNQLASERWPLQEGDILSLDFVSGVWAQQSCVTIIGRSAEDNVLTSDILLVESEEGLPHPEQVSRVFSFHRTTGIGLTLDLRVGTLFAIPGINQIHKRRVHVELSCESLKVQGFVDIASLLV